MTDASEVLGQVQTAVDNAYAAGAASKDADLAALEAQVTALENQDGIDRATITALNGQITALKASMAANTTLIASQQATIADLKSRLQALLPDEVLLDLPDAFRVNLKANTYGGANGSVYVLPLSRPATKAKLVYDLTFSPGFIWSRGGKVPGLSGVVPGVSPGLPAGGQADAGNVGWSGRLMWLGPTAYSHVGTKPNEAVAYMYHPGQKDAYGDNVWTNKSFVEGTQRVEVYYELNDIGKANGVLQVSISGVLVIDLHDFVYRTRADVQITHLMRSIFQGGNDLSWSAPKDQWIEIKNLKVTTPQVV